MWHCAFPPYHWPFNRFPLSYGQLCGFNTVFDIRSICSIFTYLFPHSSSINRSWLHNLEPKNKTTVGSNGGPTSCSKDLAKTKINTIRGDNVRFPCLHIISRRSFVERKRDTRCCYRSSERRPKLGLHRRCVIWNLIHSTNIPIERGLGTF